MVGLLLWISQHWAISLVSLYFSDVYITGRNVWVYPWRVHESAKYGQMCGFPASMSTFDSWVTTHTCMWVHLYRYICIHTYIYIYIYIYVFIIIYPYLHNIASHWLASHDQEKLNVLTPSENMVEVLQCSRGRATQGVVCSDLVVQCLPNLFLTVGHKERVNEVVTMLVWVNNDVKYGLII